MFERFGEFLAGVVAFGEDFAQLGRVLFALFAERVLVFGERGLRLVERGLQVVALAARALLLAALLGESLLGPVELAMEALALVDCLGESGLQLLVLVACGGVELAAQLIEILLVCGLGFGDRLLEPGDLVLPALLVGGGGGLRLGEGGVELLDLGAQCFALFGGGAEGGGGVFERFGELFADAVAFGEDFAQLGRVLFALAAQLAECLLEPVTSPLRRSRSSVASVSAVCRSWCWSRAAASSSLRS